MKYTPPRLPSQLTYNDLNGAEAVDILTDWFRQLVNSQPWAQPHITLPMAKFVLKVDIDIEMYPGGTVPVASPPDTMKVMGAVSLQSVINAAPVAGGQPPDRIREQHDMPIPQPSYGPRDTGSHLFLADMTLGPPRERHTHLASEQQDGVSRPVVSEPVADAFERKGIVAEGYVFSNEVVNDAPVEQHIEVTRYGGIDVDLTGQGRMKRGDETVHADTSHYASVKTAGDAAGARYGSVSGTYDLGPAGLSHGGGGRGLYGDGRPRLSFGNQHKG
jgi:hypothetical protein